MGRKGKETTVSERKIILNLHNQNKTYAEIAKAINRSRYTVRSVIKRLKGKENVEDHSRSGRPPKLSEREKRKVVNIIKQNPKTSSTAIAAMLREDLGTDVHPITVRRVLKSAGYNARVARKKPFISKINKKKRIEFANEFVHKKLDFWDKVLFSDESKFNIFRSDGRVLVWRKPNTEFEVKNLQSTVKHGGGGVMVWGCMSSSGVGNLVFIEGTMDQYVYLNILKENLKKSVENLNLGVDFYFQQDNDPKHTAYNVRQWIIFNTPHTLPSPPQSPDLNPIENIWHELEERIRKHHISSKADLKRILLQEWNAIEPAVTCKLVHSMPDRLREVLKRKGLPTKY